MRLRVVERRKGAPATAVDLAPTLVGQPRVVGDRPGTIERTAEEYRRACHPPCGFLSGAMSGIDLFWLPLGAGGHSVRLNGRAFEALVAALERRGRLDLYHSALEVHAPEGRFVIEMTPVPAGAPERRGVVGGGSVGARAARGFRLFRYELRRWRDGIIPDLDEAVESPQRLSDDADTAGRLLELVPRAPTPVWGRDELGAGEMWNSNSLISWLVVRTGLDVDAIHPPAGGRAPGWRAGIVVARREVELQPDAFGRAGVHPRLRRSSRW